MCFFNTKDGQTGTRSISWIKNGFGVDWVFHQNKEIDIAIIPFGINEDKDDVRTILEKSFIHPNRELYDVIFLSY